MTETIRYPETKENQFALDGILFTFYVQRFDDGEPNVGGWAIDLRNRKNFTIWPSEPIGENAKTFEEFTDDDEDN